MTTCVMMQKFATAVHDSITPQCISCIQTIHHSQWLVENPVHLFQATRLLTAPGTMLNIGCPKKVSCKLSFVSSPNIDRFSEKFFQWHNLENRSIFDEDMDKSLQLTFRAILYIAPPVMLQVQPVAETKWTGKSSLKHAAANSFTKYSPLKRRL